MSAHALNWQYFNDDPSATLTDPTIRNYVALALKDLATPPGQTTTREIAEYVGLTRAKVARALTELERRGVAKCEHGPWPMWLGIAQEIERVLMVAAIHPSPVPLHRILYRCRHHEVNDPYDRRMRADTVRCVLQVLSRHGLLTVPRPAPPDRLIRDLAIAAIDVPSDFQPEWLKDDDAE